VSIPRLTLTALPGTHGQDLLVAGHAPQVLTLVGRALSTLQLVPTDTVPSLDGGGTVVVHGDFGPQNMLFDLEAGTVTGVLDWESAHVGGPVEDLAWAEWLVRMHHPDAIGALDSLFVAAAVSASWTERQAEMIRHVEALAELCEAGDMTESAADWRERLRCTEAWSE
jgi:aminoglycoside phosphotransferase (APT) family kinase protein